MKFVIEIPADVKAVIDRNGTNEIVAETLWQAVKNGTPLPKGHGRLIDADELNLDYEVEMADDWKTAHEIANCVKYAPTIIEADKESEGRNDRRDF